MHLSNYAYIIIVRHTHFFIAYEFLKPVHRSFIQERCIEKENIPRLMIWIPRFIVIEIPFCNSFFTFTYCKYYAACVPISRDILSLMTRYTNINALNIAPFKCQVFNRLLNISQLIEKSWFVKKWEPTANYGCNFLYSMPRYGNWCSFVLLFFNTMTNTNTIFLIRWNV